MSSLFVAVVVLRTPLLCSLCFLGRPLLKPLRTGSLCFSTYLFLFNPLCYYTLVLNICMELMLRGQVWLPPFCQTLDSSAQSRKLIPVWTVVTTQKRHSKQHRTQSRMVQATTETGWGQALALQEPFATSDIIKDNAQKAFSGVSRVTAPSSCTAINLGRSFHHFTTKYKVIKWGLNQEVKNILPLFLAASCPKKHFRRCC